MKKRSIHFDETKDKTTEEGLTEPGHVAFKEEETPELLFPAVIDKGADERPKDNVEEPPPHEYEKKEQTPTRIFDTGGALLRSSRSRKSGKLLSSKALRSLKSGKSMRESVKELVDHITTNEPTFPSEHSYRQGNATLLGLIGFIGATLTSSLVELFAPNASSQPVWLWFIGFGGVLQVIAAEHELLMGNSLTATIFATYGFHWIGAGVLSGHLVIFQSVTPPDNPGTSIGCYYIFLTLATISYTGCAIFNPRGSWLLVWTLIAVIMKLVFLVIDAWYEDEGITRTAGFFGTLASLLALYAFVADAVSEFGQTTLPTGKFGVGVISRQEIREEIDEALAAED